MHRCLALAHTEHRFVAAGPRSCSRMGADAGLAKPRAKASALANSGLLRTTVRILVSFSWSMGSLRRIEPSPSSSSVGGCIARRRVPAPPTCSALVYTLHTCPCTRHAAQEFPERPECVCQLPPRPSCESWPRRPDPHSPSLRRSLRPGVRSQAPFPGQFPCAQLP
eukprot:scaffold187598_cov30-Tisochrysis_lutea.AAC.4